MKIRMFKFIKSTRPILISAALALLTFGALQINSWGRFADPDGFYHAKVSQLLAAGELTNKFPWNHYTTWVSGYADQHYLYHWLLVPFSNINFLPLSIILFSTIFVACFAWLLRKFNVPYIWFWISLMLFGSLDFLFRINLVKANTISLALLAVIIFLAHKYALANASKAKIQILTLLGLVSGIFVWTYGGFVCVPLVLAAQTFAYFVTTRKIVIAPFLVSSIGITLGVLLHPHGSNYGQLLYDQLFLTGLGAGTKVPAGNEWLAYNITYFIKTNAVILLAWLLSLITVVSNLIKTKRIDRDVLWTQLLALGLLVLTLWHRRFVEYWVPFTVLAMAVSLKQSIQQINLEAFKKTWIYWQVKFSAATVVIILLVAFIYNTATVAKLLKEGEKANRFQPVAQWLEQNTQPKDIVLNTQWDQFPQLFYWNSQNYYMVGLDPTFMFIDNPDRYWQWRVIADDDQTQWSSLEDVKSIIKNDLNSHYLVVDPSRNPDIIEFLGNEPVFKADGLVIMKVD